MREHDRDPLDHTPKQVTDLFAEWGKRRARFHYQVDIVRNGQTVASGFARDDAQLSPTLTKQKFYNVGDPIGKPYKGSNTGTEDKLFQDVHVHDELLITASIGTTQPSIRGVNGVSGLIDIMQVELEPAPSPTSPRIKVPPGSTNCNRYEV